MGWTLGETFTWVKNHYKPIQGKRRVNNLTEFVFMFYKGKMPELDRLSIGVPYKDISNAKRFSGGRNLRCRGNAWEIPYKTINSSKDKLHNDRFPIELPEMCIKLANLKAGSVIVDPFAGSGTTLLAAKNLGHNYIGFEKNPEHHATATKRLA
jgi:site-specific DNA-methyltransferase (adenine-specific)